MPSQPPGMPLPLPNSLTFESLFIIWQMGAASLLGLLLSPQGRLATMRLASLESSGNAGDQDIRSRAARARIFVT